MIPWIDGDDVQLHPPAAKLHESGFTGVTSSERSARHRSGLFPFIHVHRKSPSGFMITSPTLNMKHVAYMTFSFFFSFYNPVLDGPARSSVLHASRCRQGRGDGVICVSTFTGARMRFQAPSDPGRV